VTSGQVTPTSRGGHGALHHGSAISGRCAASGAADRREPVAALVLRLAARVGPMSEAGKLTVERQDDDEGAFWR
jgi:hypothetical protein